MVRDVAHLTHGVAGFIVALAGLALAVGLRYDVAEILLILPFGLGLLLFYWLLQQEELLANAGYAMALELILNRTYGKPIHLWEHEIVTARSRFINPASKLFAVMALVAVLAACTKAVAIAARFHWPATTLYVVSIAMWFVPAVWAAVASGNSRQLAFASTVIAWNKRTTS